jgi:hypothetical protein
VSNSAGQKTCPSCRLLVEVHSDRIEPHQRFTDDLVQGRVNGMPVPGVAPCLAGSGSYSWWQARMTSTDLPPAPPQQEQHRQRIGETQ